jgi:surface-anchored protein
VDVNTHTHANWVFSKPGAYLARIEISAELIDGSKVTDTRELRFAVGSRTSTEDALAASWRGVAAAAPAASMPTSGDAARAGRDPLVTVLIAVLAIGLAGGLVAVGVRGSRAKRRARSVRPGGA